MQKGRRADKGVYDGIPHSNIAASSWRSWPDRALVDRRDAVLFAVIVLVYVRLALREERNMIARFGNAHRDYLQRVPMFFPPGRMAPPV
jgi:hypothetical protein